MPELPEVETIARAVGREIVGATLQSAEFFRNDIRGPIPIGQIRSQLTGQCIRAVSRRSKFFMLETDQGSALFHLGMTGIIDINDCPKPRFAHTHAIFEFALADGRSRYFHFIDPRRFGQIGYLERGQQTDAAAFKDLGVEPLDLSIQLGDYLWNKSRNKTAPIKNFVMDQRVIVGVGNIYASESLFKTGVRPTKPSGSISRATFRELGVQIRKTLNEAIQQGGTSFRDFRHVDGSRGYFETKLFVYGRKSEPCLVCREPIKQIRQAGRSSFYCPKCQS
jgi:formamidopyrimidine-DNA glycosylase